MKINKDNYKAVWMDGSTVYLIDQIALPFEFKIFEAKNYLQTCHAIKTMITRGAGSIGAAAAYAMAQAALEAEKNDNYEKNIRQAKKIIEATRPTAQNLFSAVDKVFNAALKSAQQALDEAHNVVEKDISDSRKIASFGNEIISDGFGIATHCNAGWLAFIDRGTALAPIYQAFDEGKKIFVYVDETRPRSQGARLTAWELYNEGIEHVIIPDNATAYLMSKGKINMMIVGADRIAANGDTANKIGTLEKAIAAKTFGVPFYVAAPSTTFDFLCKTGEAIPIEERSQDEVLFQQGMTEDDILQKILVASPGSKALNLAFDVTPAEFITGFITEKGILKPSELSKFFI